MKPAFIFGGTFLLWIVAKGEFAKYAALATTKATPSTSGSPTAATGAGNNFFDNILKDLGLGPKPNATTAQTNAASDQTLSSFANAIIGAVGGIN